MASQTFKLNPGLRWRWEGNDKVLLSTLVGMNRTAGEVLELCHSHHTVGAIVQAMGERYPSVAADKMCTDIERLVAKLRRWNVLVSEGGEAVDVAPAMTASYLQHIASYFGNRLSAPVRVALEVTFACDAKCQHCYAAPARADPRELRLAAWKRVVDELQALHVFSLSLTGGEPLMRPDLEELIAHAGERGIRTTVATNGGDLRPERIRTLLAAGVKAVFVSLDGAVAATHDRFRGYPGLFDRIMDAVPRLIEHGVAVALLTTISRPNLQEITDIMTLADTLGAPRLVLMNLLPVGRGATNAFLSATPEDYLQLLPRIYEHERRLSRTAVLYPSVPAAFYERSLGLDVYKKLKREGRISSCGAGVATCVISPLGDVKPCDVSGEMSLGNVLERPLADIWRTSPVLSQLRSVSKRDQRPCQSCRLVAECCAGCLALYSQIGPQGDPEKSDPACEQCFAAFEPYLQVDRCSD